MKLAVVDHLGNFGGGSRVVRSLLPALKAADASLDITFFVNARSFAREGLEADFARSQIRVEFLRSLAVTNSIPNDTLRAIAQAVQQRYLSNQRWLPHWISGDASREISERVQGFDLVFYPWPFLLKFPTTECPAVGLFHDFNYKYYFGGNFVFSAAQRKQLESDMPRWMSHAVPVCSTNFMARELQSFYPDVAHPPHVVHLPPLSAPSTLDQASALAVARGLGVDGPFVLYPTHLCSHKNHGPLIAAIAELNRHGRRVSLVLTGAGTEGVRGTATSIGVRLSEDGNGDVKGLGYISNHEMDCLTQCANVVVSASLYEAGNGPGLDAWGRGVPVAMSNIPAFVEHMSTFGVKAQLFDPRSPSDIAANISSILDNPDAALADATASRHSLEQVTWRSTADKYLSVFRSVLDSRSTF